MSDRHIRVRAGADRWLVSYADLVTLLLAFFATTYGVSHLDSGKLSRAAGAIRESLGQGPQAAPDLGSADAPGDTAADTERHAPTAPPDQAVGAVLERALADDIAAGAVELAVAGERTVLSLPEAASFDSGSTDVRQEVGAVLDRFADIVAVSSAHVRVEGHTDDVPVRSARFSSNWELSTARAAAVVAALVARGIDPARLSAAGYGEFHPRVPNESEVARAANRRVDIVLVLDAEGRP
jgi:chemotaxis protein MotB